MAAAGVGPSAGGGVGSLRRVLGAGLSADAARARVAPARGARGLLGRLRSELHLPGAVSGRSHPRCAAGDRRVGGGDQCGGVCVRATRAPYKEKAASSLDETALRNNPGSDLLSHTPAHAVPSAVAGLTSVFGMGTGGTLPL